ncbi:MAG: Smr/MutS family protein [Taibaiella sp.]|nr:Smr/MutS family protein [Taibaiella sp.]
MKFSVGDKILLKRSGEEGHVIALIDKVMIEVEVNGTIFPVYVDDIDHPYLKWFTEKKPAKKQSVAEQLPVERITERKQRLARGIYFSFMPVFKKDDFDEVVDFVKVYLLNELPVDIKFVYDIKLSQQSEFKHEGLLHSFGNVYLHNVPYDLMNNQPRFHWQFTDINNKKMAVAEGVLRIKPAKLFEHVNGAMFDNVPSFSYLLLEDFLPVKERPNIVVPENMVIGGVKQPAGKQISEVPKHEIDLHIEQLISNHSKLSTDEIMKKQLDTLEHYLQLAIMHRQDRLIVIHGLGKGKLRDEVHNVLKKTTNVGRFKNEWSGRYGFGATEVYFKY